MGGWLESVAARGWLSVGPVLASTPAVDIVAVKAPVSSNAEGGQLAAAQHLVDSRSMYTQQRGDLEDCHHIGCRLERLGRRGCPPFALDFRDRHRLCRPVDHSR